jgi:hypothetical protein
MAIEKFRNFLSCGTYKNGYTVRHYYKLQLEVKEPEGVINLVIVIESTYYTSPSMSVSALAKLDTWSQCYKTFYVRNLRMFAIS